MNSLKMLDYPFVHRLNERTIMIEARPEYSPKAIQDYMQSLINTYGELGYILDPEPYYEFGTNRRGILMHKIKTNELGNIKVLK